MRPRLANGPDSGTGAGGQQWSRPCGQAPAAVRRAVRPRAVRPASPPEAEAAAHALAGLHPRHGVHAAAPPRHPQHLKEQQPQLHGAHGGGDAQHPSPGPEARGDSGWHAEPSSSSSSGGGDGNGSGSSGGANSIDEPASTEQQEQEQKQQQRPPPKLPAGAVNAARQLLARWQALQDARSPEAKAAARPSPEALALLSAAIQNTTTAAELAAIVHAFGTRLLHPGVAAATVQLAKLMREARGSAEDGGGGFAGSDSASGSASGADDDDGDDSSGSESGGGAGGDLERDAVRWLRARLTPLISDQLPRMSALQVGLLLRALPRLRGASDELVRRLQARAARVMPSATEPHTLSAMLNGAARLARVRAARQERGRGRREAAGPSGSGESSSGRQAAAAPQGRPQPLPQQRQQPPQQQQQHEQQEQGQQQARQAAGGASPAAPSPEFVDAWLRQSKAHLPSFSPTYLATSAHALASMGRRPPEDWVAAFLEASERRLAESAAAAPGPRPADPAGGADGGGEAEAGGSGSGAEGSIGGSSISSGVGSDGGSSVSSSADGRAAAADAAAARDGLFTAGELSMTLWALARLGVRPGAAWCAAFRGACRRVYWRMPGPVVSGILWATARLRLPVTEAWLTDMLWQAQRTLKGMEVSQLAGLIWAVAELRRKPAAPWVAHYCKHLSRCMAGADPHSFATVVASLGRLRIRPSRRWLDDFAAALHPRLGSFSPRDSAATLAGFADLGYAPSAEWMFDFLLEARTALPRYTLRDAVTTLRALAGLSALGSRRVRAPEEWVAALLVRARACVAAGGQGGGGGGGGGEDRRLAVNLLVHVAQLGVAPGTALLTAALGRVLGGGAPAAPLAAAAPQEQEQQHQHQQPQQQQQQQQPLEQRLGQQALPHQAAASQPAAHPISDAAAEWLLSNPRDAARLLLALSLFWRRSGDECAWLRRNARVVDGLVAIAARQLPAAEAGVLVQLLQALASMRYNPGAAWLAAHEARALAQLPALRPAALQGLVLWYGELDYRPADALAEAAARGAEAAAAEKRVEAAREARREEQRRRSLQAVQERRRAEARQQQEQLRLQRERQRRRRQEREGQGQGQGQDDAQRGARAQAGAGRPRAAYAARAAPPPSRGDPNDQAENEAPE